jgi:malic enzyme
MLRSLFVPVGNRILGLGDLGANGMGISVGKAILYNVFGGLKPENVLPVVLDVGCGTAELRASDRYVGVDMDRVKDEPYFEFVDEFHNACRVCIDRELGVGMS